MSPPPDVPRPGHGGHGAGPHDGLPALVHRQARHLAHQQAQEAAPQGRAGNEPSRIFTITEKCLLLGKSAYIKTIKTLAKQVLTRGKWT